MKKCPQRKAKTLRTKNETPCIFSSRAVIRDALHARAYDDQDEDYDCDEYDETNVHPSNYYTRLSELFSPECSFALSNFTLAHLTEYYA